MRKRTSTSSKSSKKRGRAARAAKGSPSGARVTDQVALINARTCGIYKNGGIRYRTNGATGERTEEVDDELNDLVDAYMSGRAAAAVQCVDVDEVWVRRVLVPTYFDKRFEATFEAVKQELGWGETTIGELEEDGLITVRGGHGSPGNDQRSGEIPYIKVSDIRGLRVNINPTNLVSVGVARKYWKGGVSGLEAFDLITPNRASSNIGEFAVLLPGEEQVVLTKEMFVFRVEDREESVWDPFSLFWALCLRATREQWRRIALMQTNREDCGQRYREIRLPLPPSRDEAMAASNAFRSYFKTIATAWQEFRTEVGRHSDRYIANVVGAVPEPVVGPDGTEE